MKTRSIARGIVGSVAALLGVMAAGCSAESGAPDESAEIGSTSQALVQGVPSSSPDYRVQNPSACRFKDAANSNKEYIMLAGGLVPGASPSVTNRILLASDVASPGGAWTLQTDTLSVARHGAKAIQISDTDCILTGGLLANGNSSNAVDVLHMTTSAGSTPTVARSATITPANMGSARGLHEVTTCVENGNTHLVAVSGQSAGAGTGLVSIEVSDTVTDASWSAWTSTNLFSTGITDFGLAKNGSSNQYFIAGGQPSGGTYTNEAFVLTFDSTCGSPTLTSILDNTVSHNASNLSEAVRGNVVIFDGAADTFIVVAGVKNNSGSPALSSIKDKFVVNDWANAYTTRTSLTTGLTTLTYKPTLVRSATNDTKHMLVGGSNAAISASIADVQQFVSGGTGFTSKGTLSPASYQPGVAFLETNGNVTVATGVQLGTGLTGAVSQYTP